MSAGAIHGRRARSPRARRGRALSPALLLAALLLAALVPAACSDALVRVQPWERGDLAGDLMRPDLNPMEDRDWEHIYFSKEATPGDPSNGGGGCGCN